MKTPECNREPDVLDAVTSGCWPHRCATELQVHVRSCALCRDTVEVAVALAGDHAAALGEARIPSAGLVWWRAELKARQDAIQAASRPIAIVEYISGACIAGVMFAMLRRLDMSMIPAILVGQTLHLLIAAGALLVLAPIALYVALSDE